MSKALTVELLQQLEDRWRDQGAPVVDNLNPGLEDAEIDRLLGPLGLQLPAEARVWWGWHDGAPFSPTGRRMSPGWEFIPLAEAVERTVQERDWARELDKLCNGSWRDGVDQGARFGQGLLTWSEEVGGNQLAIDTVDPEPSSPVYYLDNVERDEAGPRTASIADAVKQMIDAIDCGAHVYDPQEGIWLKDNDRLPDRLHGLSLVS